MNIAGSPPRRRLLVALAVLGASAFSEGAARAADEEPPFFAERFGGMIERVVVGPDGTIYVAGRTKTADLPASTSAPVPGSDVLGQKGLFFAAALEPDGSPRWTSYAVGQTGPVRGLAVASDGSVWLGAYGSVDSVAAFQPRDAGRRDNDGVVAKFAPDGTLLLASNLGGLLDDTIADVAVAANGDAIVSGSTSSDDFPLASLPPGGLSHVTDAFVTRIRADGSGVAWTRRFGSDIHATRFNGGGVAVDPSDGTIVVAIDGTRNEGRAPFAVDLDPPRGRRARRFDGADGGPIVVRLSPEGEQTQGAQIHGLGYASVWTPLPVTLGADGSVLVGGNYGVARITRELFLGMTDAWFSDGRRSVVARICTVASGRVVIAERDQFGPALTRIVVRDSYLSEGEAPVDRAAELGFIPADIAVAADGSLLVVGQGSGVPFRAAYDRDDASTGCIARVPLDGVRAPTRLRARVAGATGADLAWSRDGDAASGFDIERTGAGETPVVVGHVPGNVFRFRATGLTPGANHGLRVVAVFASGVRSASPVRSVTTPPASPIEVVATDGPGRVVDLRLDDPNGDAVGWQVERRFGDGEWMETGLNVPYPIRRVGERIQSPSTTDVIPDVTVPVRYRVRAAQSRRRTAWIESAPLVPQSTMRVTQTSGHLGVNTETGVEFLVAGTLGPMNESTPLSFDPSAQDFRVLYGPAAAPAEFVIRAGYPGWTATDGVFRWRAADSMSVWENGSEIVLDLARGEFLVRLIARGGVDVATNQVAVNLEFGEFSGGDVKAWRGRSGWNGRLSFGEASSTQVRAGTR
jgi:hypothetical protein